MLLLIAHSSVGPIEHAIEEDGGVVLLLIAHSSAGPLEHAIEEDFGVVLLLIAHSSAGPIEDYCGVVLLLLRLLTCYKLGQDVADPACLVCSVAWTRMGADALHRMRPMLLGARVLHCQASLILFGLLFECWAGACALSQIYVSVTLVARFLPSRAVCRARPKVSRRWLCVLTTSFQRKGRVHRLKPIAAPVSVCDRATAGWL